MSGFQYGCALAADLGRFPALRVSRLDEEGQHGNGPWGVK